MKKKAIVDKGVKKIPPKPKEEVKPIEMESDHLHFWTCKINVVPSAKSIAEQLEQAIQYRVREKFRKLIAIFQNALQLEN